MMKKYLSILLVLLMLCSVFLTACDMKIRQAPQARPKARIILRTAAATTAAETATAAKKIPKFLRNRP
ncbi:MAG: hypothetical protein IJD64_02440 [Clostridia bacterium]|nr:hypothetical protein [Clostridia bacterium]